MLIAPVHVVELINIPPELRVESRGYSRSAFSGSPSLRPDSAYSYVGYENLGRKRAGAFTSPWMVSTLILWRGVGYYGVLLACVIRYNVHAPSINLGGDSGHT